MNLFRRIDNALCAWFNAPAKSAGAMPVYTFSSPRPREEIVFPVYGKHKDRLQTPAQIWREIVADYRFTHRVAMERWD